MSSSSPLSSSSSIASRWSADRARTATAALAASLDRLVAALDDRLDAGPVDQLVQRIAAPRGVDQVCSHHRVVRQAHLPAGRRAVAGVAPQRLPVVRDQAPVAPGVEHLRERRRRAREDELRRRRARPSAGPRRPARPPARPHRPAPRSRPAWSRAASPRCAAPLRPAGLPPARRAPPPAASADREARTA